MMFKLIGIALTGVVVVTLLKNSKPEFSVFATIATGVVMVITMLSALRDVVLSFDSIVEKSGIDDAVLLIPLGSSSAVINGNSWSRHFAVKTYGDGFDLLVNTVDPYSGTVRVDSDATVMTVTAEGGWSILLQ